jgi:hypothetical protein
MRPAPSSARSVMPAAIKCVMVTESAPRPEARCALSTKAEYAAPLNAEGPSPSAISGAVMCTQD